MRASDLRDIVDDVAHIADVIGSQMMDMSIAGAVVDGGVRQDPGKSCGMCATVALLRSDCIWFGDECPMYECRRMTE